MWKKIAKFLLTVAGIAASVAAILTFYKKKKQQCDEESEFSDIFEEEDYDLDENL